MYFEVNGKRSFAATGGKPFVAGRPTVVFLHGSGFDHRSWGLQARFFAFRNYAVLVPDLPGHSLSAGPPLESIEAMADWLQDALIAVGAGSVSLVGHSQGALVAMEHASRYPDRVRTVSFVTSGLRTPVNETLLAASRDDPDVAVDMMLSWGFGAAGHLYRGPVPGNSMLESGRRILRANAIALAADLHACNAYGNGRAAAAAVSAPCQVLIAARDRMAPAKATSELVSQLANPEVHVVAGSGHMLPKEAPDRCRQLLRDFIFRHNPAA